MTKRTKSKPERFMMRIKKGGIQPADRFTESALRRRNYRVGDLVSVEIKKPREGWYHRRAHVLGLLLSENLDAFAGMEPHSVLKRLQIEGNIGCDEMAIIFPGIGPCVYRIPQSLSYENMDQGAFEIIYQQFCQYVVKTYWQGLTEFQMDEMVSVMDREAS